MILLKRLRNIWAWSAYHPSGNLPENVGFTWTDWKKSVNTPEPGKMAVIIKRNKDSVKEILNEQ